MASSTTIYNDEFAQRTRFILRHSKGAHSGTLCHMTAEDAFKAIRGVTGDTSRQRADERLRRLREAEAEALGAELDAAEFRGGCE